MTANADTNTDLTWCELCSEGVEIVYAKLKAIFSDVFQMSDVFSVTSMPTV